jgi:hypothetical protein
MDQGNRAYKLDVLYAAGSQHLKLISLVLESLVEVCLDDGLNGGNQFFQDFEAVRF